MNKLRQFVAWFVDQIKLRTNAPRWIALITAATTAWVVDQGWDAALVGVDIKLILGAAIPLVLGTIVQRTITWSRFSPRLGDAPIPGVFNRGPVGEADLNTANVPDVPPDFAPSEPGGDLPSDLESL